MADILVMADSHRHDAHIRRAAELFLEGGFAMAVHLGDLAADARRFRELTGFSPISVAGNCDMLSPAAPPKELTTALFGANFLICHGDRYGVKSSLARLSYRAEELSCGAALFGHTHRAFAGYVGRALLINPGALQDGRYAVLNVEDGRVVPRLLRF
ncbi:MAG: YfcE family phosphodiesterase [Clostridiales bacterium]|jgi:putative phosphoesterase|nr:YfcE family phosphodiesterase [Clostridiales bacterium]OPZ68593.1 MAG: phosphodiesterase [Firmicutes bacterium ADurb.Bin467]